MMVIFRFTVALLLLLFIAGDLCAGSLPPVRNNNGLEIDLLVEGAIAKGLISGGVVLVGNRGGILFQKAYGRISPEASARPVTLDTVFDLASLTKVIATAPAVMKLAEDGRLSLVDPIVKWFPEFVGRGKDDLLVLNLLTHTSGLDDFPLSSANPMQSAVEGAAAQALKGLIGSRFKYADINFILLAEIVRRATGVGLDLYTTACFYRPMGMKDTSFNPPREQLARYAPTIGSENTNVVGQPQDYVARQLGGVAGHAGLFSTVADLALFCRMILGSGELNGRRIFSERAINQMTAPYFSRGGAVARGLGWDIDSPFSAPRGSGFSRWSFGHTGYSGSSVWIEPATDLYVILLTSRLEFRSVNEFKKLRGSLSTLAAQMFAAPVDFLDMGFVNDD
jgi:CubicO group peptidase (beta-lactamase class C family)